MLTPTTMPVIINLGPEGGINVSLDTAFVYGLQVGDRLSLEDDDGKQWTVRVNEKRYTLSDKSSPKYVTITATPL